MKKLYVMTLIIILAVVSVFLFFYNDENSKNKRFLAGFNIEIEEKPYISEEILIPEEFDEYYESYNTLQIESGLSLTPYKGKSAVRYTYKVLNFPDTDSGTVFANVITINSKPVAGDINSPKLSGFLLPLSYLLSNK